MTGATETPQTFNAESQEKYEALLGEVLVTVRETQEQEEKTAAAAMILRQQTTNKQACF